MTGDQMNALCAGQATPVRGIVATTTPSQSDDNEQYLHPDLLESERLAQSTLDALSAHIAILDDQGKIIGVNRAWREFAFSNASEHVCLLEGANYLTVCDAAQGKYSEEARPFAEGLRAVLRGERDEFAIEYPCHSPQEERWFLCRITRFLGNGPARLVVAHENITPGKKTEQALRDSLERYHGTLDHMMEGCQIIGFDWRYLYVNDVVVHHGRHSREELLGRTMIEVYPGIETTEMFTILRRCMEERTPHRMENLFDFGGGSYGWFDLRIQPVPEGLFILSIDITERKRAEAELREKEAQLHAADQRLAGIVQGMTEACFSLDADWRFTFVNDRCETLLLHTRAEMLGRSIWDVFHKLVGTPMERHYRFAMKERVPVVFEAFSPIAHRWLDIRIFPLGNGLAAFLLDIHHRKQADEALRESEALFSKAFRLSPDCMIITNIADRTIIRANDAMCRLWNCTPEEVIGKRANEYSEWLTPAERSNFLDVLQDKGEYLDYETTLRMHDERLLSFMLSSRMITLHGEPCVLSVLHDITERKRADAVVGKLASIVESSSDAIIGKDLQGIVTSWNYGAERVFGYSAQEMIGQSITRLIPPERQHEEQKILEKIHRGENVPHFETVRMTKAGSLIDVSITVSAIKDSAGKVIGASKVARDITEWKRVETALLRSEEQLRESERRFSSMMESVQLLSLMLDTAGRITYCNDYLLQLTGWQREEVLHQNWFELFVPNGLDKLRGVFAKLLIDKPTVWHHENEIITRSGERRLIRWNNTILRSISGEVIGTASIGEDITEQKKAEEALRESEERFREMAENIDEVFWMTDPAKNTMLYISPAYEAIWGRTRDSLYQSPRNWIEAVHPEDRQRVADAAIRQQEIGSYQQTYRIVRPDGSQRWIQDRAFPIRDAEGQVYRIVGTAEDITAQRQLEEQLRQVQKMDALGTLAGGIAHDFNNILLAISGNTQLALSDLPQGHPARASLSEIEMASARAGELVRGILTFSRQQETKRQVLQLRPIVEEALKLLRSTIPVMIQLQSHFAPEVPAIAADTTQVFQIIMNLATNASHAIGSRQGMIELRLDSLYVTPDLAARTPGLREGRYARLSVTDNGSGMDEATLSRIFDPFFTTKPVGQGTGLGLAVVDGIMKNHDGVVTVSSQIGKGTTFFLYFPATEVPMEPIAPPRPEVAVTQEKHILYVDDEDALIRLAGRLFKHLGYRVTTHSNPLQAIEEFRSHPHDFDAVVSDVSMPGLTGFDLARELLKLHPDTPIVLASGYVQAEEQELAAQMGIRATIQKTNIMAELGPILEQIFQEKRNPERG